MQFPFACVQIVLKVFVLIFDGKRSRNFFVCITQLLFTYIESGIVELHRQGIHFLNFCNFHISAANFYPDESDNQFTVMFVSLALVGGLLLWQVKDKLQYFRCEISNMYFSCQFCISFRVESGSCKGTIKQPIIILKLLANLIY
eukprot:TRINITY_DN5358_c0_g1_i5.p4 TRINITY_DN5358_c0_g1~~TRINITY_DN5358_c0_g1_i5.p4  ORF type:complete len:144 (+),score=0.47 TRINITY_DN5358_c0_g1_i5:1132-1563(+)